MNKRNNQLNSDIPEDYNLGWKEDGTLYIAPIVLSKSNNYEEREDDIYRKIRAYYRGDSTIVGTIMSCISEVGSNFWHILKRPLIPCLSHLEIETILSWLAQIQEWEQSLL